MLNPLRALTLNYQSGRPLPKVDDLSALYGIGCTPRHGEVIMIAGRSGTQKSGFALWWVDEMRLPTLYFSADMSAFTASARIASKRTKFTTDRIEQILKGNDEELKATIMSEMQDSGITFSFGSPITWRQVDRELDAYVELWNRYPEILVFDNLMDFEGADADYAAQMDVIQEATSLARHTGATVLLMHHASDKSWDARDHPWEPPSRDQIKNGLSEKPELTLSVALNPTTMEYKIAVIKQRMGPSDPSARRFVASIRCRPEITTFTKFGEER